MSRDPPPADPDVRVRPPVRRVPAAVALHLPARPGRRGDPLPLPRVPSPCVGPPPRDELPQHDAATKDPIEEHALVALTEENDMTIRYRKRIRVLPGVHLNISRSSRGWTHSWSVKVLGINWNSRTRRRSVDLPGGFSWQEDARGHGTGAPRDGAS